MLEPGLEILIREDEGYYIEDGKDRGTGHPPAMVMDRHDVVEIWPDAAQIQGGQDLIQEGSKSLILIIKPPHRGRLEI